MFCNETISALKAASLFPSVTSVMTAETPHCLALNPTKCLSVMRPELQGSMSGEVSKMSCSEYYLHLHVS